MFKNEKTVLEKENKKQSLKLKDEDNATIKKIMESMNIFKVNSYDAQVIRRDLIGMAQEADLRDSNLKEFIGSDPKEFARDLIANSNGPSKIEVVLNFLSMLSGYIIVWSIILAFGAYDGLSWDISIELFLLFSGLVLIIFISEGVLAPFVASKLGFEKVLSYAVPIILIIIFVLIVRPINFNTYISTVNLKYVVVIFVLVYLLSKYLTSKNIQSLSKNKLNYIKDLKK